MSISSLVMEIFFCKGFTRNLEIGNTPVWVLPSVWRLRQVRHTKFGTDAVNKMLPNVAKYQVYSFCCLWVIKGKPPRLRLIYWNSRYCASSSNKTISSKAASTASAVFCEIKQLCNSCNLWKQYKLSISGIVKAVTANGVCATTKTHKTKEIFPLLQLP